MSDDGLNGKDANKTQLWLQTPASTAYQLPYFCPDCLSEQHLRALSVYVGVFPYIHTGVKMQCVLCRAEYTFCFPYHKAMPMGYQIFDSESNQRGYTNRTCPFHKDTHLKPLRLYGDLVFNDGTVKMQLSCPICYYSERVTFK